MRDAKTIKEISNRGSIREDRAIFGHLVKADSQCSRRSVGI